jgi:hypothetical protein
MESNVQINYIIEKYVTLKAQANVYKESAEKSRDLTDRTIATSNEMIDTVKKQLKTITSMPFGPDWNKH